LSSFEMTSSMPSSTSLSIARPTRKPPFRRNQFGGYFSWSGLGAKGV
jgi:hypothetical protein